MIAGILVLIASEILFHKTQQKSMWSLFYALFFSYSAFFFGMKKGICAPYELRYHFDQISVIVIMLSFGILAYRLLFLAYLSHQKTKRSHGKFCRFMMMILCACGILVIAWAVLLGTFLLSFEIPQETVIEKGEKQVLLAVREKNASDEETYYATADNPFIQFKRDDETDQKVPDNNEAPEKPEEKEKSV